MVCCTPCYTLTHPWLVQSLALPCLSLQLCNHHAHYNTEDLVFTKGGFKDPRRLQHHNCSPESSRCVCFQAVRPAAGHGRGCIKHSCPLLPHSPYTWCCQRPVVSRLGVGIPYGLAGLQLPIQGTTAAAIQQRPSSSTDVDLPVAEPLAMLLVSIRMLHIVMPVAVL